MVTRNRTESISTVQGASAAWALPRCRILIVDDCPETRFVYKRHLRGDGEDFEITEAETIEQAIAELDSGSFDCMLLDYCLPDGEGIELLEQVVKSGARRSVAVIMITGQGDESIAVDAMKLGAKDYLSKDDVTAESLLCAVNYALEAVRAEHEESRYREELERKSVTDPLTGLRNRRFLEEQLAAELHRSDRYGTPLSLLLIDLDHFKAVNDTYGHIIGDRVLKTFSQMLNHMARASDHVARFGGEEFCVLLTNTDEDGARLFAERTCDEASRQSYFDGSGNAFSVTCSIGVAQNVMDDIESLIHLADKALYKAKNSGRNQVCVAEHHFQINEAAV